jgi:hypothetical protein
MFKYDRRFSNIPQHTRGYWIIGRDIPTVHICLRYFDTTSSPCEILMCDNVS